MNTSRAPERASKLGVAAIAAGALMILAAAAGLPFEVLGFLSIVAVSLVVLFLHGRTEQ